MSQKESRKPAIEVKNVSKRFGSVTALDDVSFSVEEGELFFLLGPSGCGKTTMLRILAGLESADSGTVMLGGQDTAQMPPHRRGAPMVFQNYALWPHLRVKENVAFGLVERRVARPEIERRVVEALERVNLAGLGERMPGQLSGGQQQRVVLARALVLNPSVVLLDEPLSNLDAKLRTEMREEIEALHRGTSITFVYVTHDQVEALSLADRMAVLQNGKIRAMGQPRELYQWPPNLFCGGFLGEANVVEGAIMGWQGELARVETALGEWRAVSPGPGRPATGSHAHCLLRPESIGRDRGEPAGNRFEAEIHAIRFQGATVTVVLAARGVSLKSTLLSAHAADLKPGMRTSWRAEAGNTILVARE